MTEEVQKESRLKVLASGKRKTSVARVQLMKGEGKIIVNKRPFADYFPRELYKNWILAPLKAINGLNKFNIKVKVEGGGPSGQAGAVALGVARALVAYDESYRPILREKGLLTRDPRMVERKKYGLKKARRAFQYSKR